MGIQLRAVVHVPNAPLDSALLVDEETMKRRDMEERLTVLLVRLIVIIIIASSLTHSLTTAFSGLPFKFFSVFMII
jgi:hypothetical protein